MLNEIKHTSRGFRFYEFADSNGEKCTLQKSSSACQSMIWFGIEDANPLIMHEHAKKLGLPCEADRGYIKYEVPDCVLMSTRMHLDRKAALVLSDQLRYFAESGELPRFPYTASYSKEILAEIEKSGDFIPELVGAKDKEKS